MLHSIMDNLETPLQKGGWASHYLYRIVMKSIPKIPLDNNRAMIELTKGLIDVAITGEIQEKLR